MIPESGENKTIDLYVCITFPFEWRFKKKLLTDVQAFDATLHVANNMYWLFCTVQTRAVGSTNDELHIFHTHDFLNGDWQPHRLNPVVSNPSTARPAGNMFMHDGSLYRPSQICVPRYGFGLSLNRVTVLNENEFAEEVVSQASPNWRSDLLATHTLNFSDGLTVIDALIRRSRFF